MPSWARSLIVVAVGLVVWLAAKPASAAAPLCDDRGAIMLAPPPTLDAPVSSIDLGEPLDCFAPHVFDASYEKGNRSPRSPAPAHAEPMLVPAADISIPAPSIGPAPVAHETPILGRDLCDRLERPPR